MTRRKEAFTHAWVGVYHKQLQKKMVEQVLKSKVETWAEMCPANGNISNGVSVEIAALMESVTSRKLETWVQDPYIYIDSRVDLKVVDYNEIRSKLVWLFQNYIILVEGTQFYALLNS